MRRLKRLTGMMLVIALALVAAAPAFAEHIWYGTMMVDHCEEWVSLRDGPGTGCGRLAKVPLYAIVTDAEWDSIWDDFIYCNYDGQYGYILSKYLVPWADPEPEDERYSDGDLPLRVDWAEATPNVLVVDQDGEYVTIMADESVYDVALLALELADFDEDDKAVFDTEVLYEQEALLAEDHLVVKIAFYGDIPSYGIRVTDSMGETWQFAIVLSGRDGELMLTEF